jgi:hypothetical protein
MLRGRDVEDEEEEVEHAGVAELQSDEAQEIDQREAAARLGRKRSRKGEFVPSPELDSLPLEEAVPAKRRRRHRRASPASQKQPQTQKNKKKLTKQQSKTKDRERGDPVPVAVQRFTKPIYRSEDGTDTDILNAEIPFANVGGVNVIDVLLQICMELIDGFLSNLQEQAANAEDSTARRQVRTMSRTLEAFREELQTRLLEHVRRPDRSPRYISCRLK